MMWGDDMIRPPDRSKVTKITPENWQEFRHVNRAGRLCGEIRKLEPIEDQLLLAWMDCPGDDQKWFEYHQVENLIDNKYKMLMECK